MPSQTIYVPEMEYQYAEDTRDENQSIGQRLSELVAKGIEAEDKE